MPRNIFDELGVSGTKHTFGQVSEEYLTELKGTKAIKVYKEMSSNDSIVGASLLAIDLLVRQVKIAVQSANDDQESVEKSNFLRENWGDMSFTPKDFMAEVMSMSPYGWAFFETVYKKRQGYKEDGSSSKYTDGKIGWRKFALRPQDTLYEWVFDTDGGVKAMKQQDPNTFKIYEIPIQKALLFRTSTYKNNPEGASLLRHAYRSWYFKKHLENIEAIGAERDLVGIPMAKVPASIMASDASPQEKAMLEAVENVLRNLRQDETAFICLPSDTDSQGKPKFEFQLISSSGTKTFDTDKIIMRKSREIAMTVLADFILLGHEQVGSLALSANKTDLFFNAIQTWVDAIVSVLNQYAVPRLFKLNGLSLENLPKFVSGEIKSVNLDVLGRYLQSLTLSGVQLFPNEILEKYLKQIADLPLDVK